MTLQYFLRLPEHKKTISIIRHGVSVGSLQGDQWDTLLFQIDGFYVEVQMEKGPLGGVLGMTAFEDTDRLAPYLEQIPVNL